MTGTEASPISTYVADSTARVGGELAARGGDATLLSGEVGCIADSGRGEVMEECVCMVLMASLHEEDKEKYSDK